MTQFLTGFEPNSYTSQALELVCPHTIKLPVSTLSKALSKGECNTVHFKNRNGKLMSVLQDEN